MSEGFPYGDIVILALIAGFILLRLRSVLGQKTGNENPDFFRPKQDDSPNNPNAKPTKPDVIIQLVEKTLKPRSSAEQEHDPYALKLEGTPFFQAITEIKALDPLFNVTAFVDGAKMAFEMVFDAFVKGDKQTLSMLLSEEIYADFAHNIDELAKQENKMETTLLAVNPKRIVSVVLDKNIARITVEFESEQVTVERGKNGEIISGDPSDVQHVVDEWLFERDVTSKNPNWKIIET